MKTVVHSLLFNAGCCRLLTRCEYCCVDDHLQHGPEEEGGESNVQEEFEEQLRMYIDGLTQKRYVCHSHFFSWSPGTVKYQATHNGADYCMCRRVYGVTRLGVSYIIAIPVTRKNTSSNY